MWSLPVVIHVALMLLGGSLFTFTEPWSFIDATYFSGITMFGIGFGDLVPTTVAGKVINTVYAVVTPGVTAITLFELSTSYLDELERATGTGHTGNNKAVPYVPRIVWMYIGFTGLLFTGSLLFMVLETFSFVDSLQFCLSMLTTLGYGVLLPTTIISKMACLVFATIGNGLSAQVIAHVGALVHRAIKQRLIRPTRKQD